MNSAKGIINGNILEELEYRRCTWWSSFLEDIAEREDGKAYDIKSIDEHFDDDTSNDDAEEAEEVQVLEDIEYHNLMNQSTQQEKTTFIMESEEMQDILNSTRPILKEHELKLKASGLERIMNTFDSVRIEREVGGWMRRKHSTDVTLAGIHSDSDTESSMSCEDDHYIRSVQKCHHMRKPKHIQYFKKCKSFQTACCKYRKLVEIKSPGPYACKCYKYNSIKSSRNEPFFAENIHKMRHCVQESGSSSTSDYDYQERRCLKRNMTPVTHTERKSDKRYSSTIGKRFIENGCGNQMVSMMERVYETPTKSTGLKSSIPNTAPSKISAKRGVSRKALSVLNITKNGNAKSTKSKHVVKTQETQKSSSECNTTFENDIQTAIAHSLKSLKQDRQCHSSEQAPSTSSESTNNSFQLAKSLRNFEKPKLVSTTKAKKKTERNKALPKAVKKQSHIKNVSQTNAAKENTFLNNIENICNSTALNGDAASKQLPSSLPAIHEISESSSTASHCTENKLHTLRKKASRGIHGDAAGKDSITTPPPAIEQVTPCKPKSKIEGMRNATTEPRRKPRRNTVNKIMGHRSSASPTLESGAKAQPNRIMLYTPQRKAPAVDGHFQVTRELMSSVIGEDHARRFFKYHVGPLTFSNTSTVYYCPPEAEPSSSDSDDDPLLKVGCCGELYESEQLNDSNAV